MKERIQKVLAAAGVASRRNIEEMVVQGRVAVNGRIASRLPVLIDPARDRVEVDGESIRLERGPEQRRFYFVMNKPKGVYTTNAAQGDQVRAIDLLPPGIPARLFPVGRLDSEAKGVLLLTNDGELTNQLTHPRYGVPKTYRAVADGHIAPEIIAELEKGIWLADGRGGGFKTGRSQIKVARSTRDKTVLDITIREGPNREIRRVLARLGHKVRDLTRIRLGPLTLDGLSPGQFRPLTPREVRELRQFCKQAADHQSPGRAPKKRRGPSSDK